MEYYSLISDEELEWLIDTARSELKPGIGATYVEMGTFLLGTIGRIAAVTPNVFFAAVDHDCFDWLDDPNNATRTLLEETFKGVSFTREFAHRTVADVLVCTPNLRLFKGKSRSQVFAGANMQFIDADHSYREVFADFWHCYAQAAPGSLVIGHDCHLADVALAIADIGSVLGESPSFPVGNLWYFRTPQ